MARLQQHGCPAARQIAQDNEEIRETEHGCFDECMMGPNVRVDGRWRAFSCPPTNAY